MNQDAVNADGSYSENDTTRHVLEESDQSAHTCSVKVSVVSEPNFLYDSQFPPLINGKSETLVKKKDHLPNWAIVCLASGRADNFVPNPIAEDKGRSFAIKDGSESSPSVRKLQTQKDNNSSSSDEVSATHDSEGEGMAGEEGKPFYYLARVPRHQGEELTEKIKNAETQVNRRTLTRDAIRDDLRNIKVYCKEYEDNFKAAIAEEKSARKALNSKRQEMDSLQSFFKRVVSIDDIDSRIRDIEHTIQHQTLPINEGKRLIREMKQLKQRREQISSKVGTEDKVEQALDEKEETEELLEESRKEVNLLRDELSKAETFKKSARERYEDEREKQRNSEEQYRAANEARQEAYVYLQSLKEQFREQNKHFFKYREDMAAATGMALKKDWMSLESFCLEQVDSFMDMWNNDDEFRKLYITCIGKSTSRILDVSDEEHPINSTKEKMAIRFEDAMEGKKPANSTEPRISIEPVSGGEELEEHQPELTEEEAELSRKTDEEEEEEAEKMNGQHRLEEVPKGKEGKESKKKKKQKKKKREDKAKAGDAAASAHQKGEAEENEEEGEKKGEGIIPGSQENPLPDSDTQPETPKEIESPEKQQLRAKTWKKRSKSTKKTMPPPAVRTRNPKQWMVWMMAVIALVASALLLAGDATLSFSPTKP